MRRRKDEWKWFVCDGTSFNTTTGRRSARGHFFPIVSVIRYGMSRSFEIECELMMCLILAEEDQEWKWRPQKKKGLW